MEDRIKKLQIQADELTKCVTENSKTQVRFPIGEKTKKVIQEKLLVSTGQTATPPTFDAVLEVEFDGKIYWLSAKAN